MSLFQRVTARLEESLIAFLMAAMAIVTFVQVVLRYGFDSGFTWAMEATTYLFAWLVLLGISYGVRVHAHIGVDVWVKKLSPRPRRAVAIAGTLAGLLYAGLMFAGSVTYLRTMIALGIEAEDIAIPRWVLLLVLPLGFGLLFVRLGQVIVRSLRGETELMLADEAAETIAQMRRSGVTGGGRHK
jgi:C4-dicarboxylate transporter DctQ subunit